MYAVIRTGGSQQRVKKGDTVRVHRISAAVGEKVSLGEVMAVKGGASLKVGRPGVPGARVEATVVAHGLGEKVLVFKKKRRKQYRRTRGHRQPFTALRIDRITAGPARKTAGPPPERGDSSRGGSHGA